MLYKIKNKLKDMITLENLKDKIGLKTKEAKIYMDLLKSGSGFASRIAAEAGIKRSTTYQILELLNQKGLVLKYVKGKKFFYTSAKPRGVLNYLEDEARKIYERQADFAEILPEMNLLYSRAEKKPRLLFYDKKADVLRLLLETIKDASENEIFGFVSIDILDKNFDKNFFKSYVKTIRLKKIKLKLINYDEDTNVKSKTDKWLVKNFSSLPKNLQPQIKISKTAKKDLSNLIFVIENRTYLIDVNPPDFMGMVIINDDLAKTFKIMFDNLWTKK